MDITIFIILLMYLILFNDTLIIKRLFIICTLLLVLQQIYKCIFKQIIEGADNLGDDIGYSKKIYDIINQNVSSLQDVNVFKKYQQRIDDIEKKLIDFKDTQNNNNNDNKKTYDDLKNSVNDLKTTQQKSIDDLKMLINTYDTWIEYIPDRYLNCYYYKNDGSWTSEYVPKFNNKYNFLSYKYIIRNKYLKIRFSYGCFNDSNIDDGKGQYYVKLPIINSKQIIADNSCKFSNDGCTTLACGINSINSSIKSIGLIRYAGSGYSVVLNCFLFDNQKIMFYDGYNDGLLGDIYGKLKNIRIMFFEIEIPISI